MAEFEGEIITLLAIPAARTYNHRHENHRIEVDTMENKKTRLTVWEAACVITGYGIGGGVLAMPYLTEKNGIVAAFLLLLGAFAVSLMLHLMIADTVMKCGAGSQIVSVFSRFLFRGRFKNLLTAVFFVLMAVVLCSNLAAYIAGAEEIIVELLPVSPLAAKLIFYVVAASVVLFGLKAVAVSEKLMVALIFVLVAVLAVSSFMVEARPLPMDTGSGKEMLAYFGMAMLAFSAFFSIPQAVEGLAGDEKKIKKAVFLGLGNNFVLISVISLCALLASEEVTKVAMTGWAAGIGQWAIYAGGIFTLLAMITTYWSISLALSGIVREQTGMHEKLCWLLATAPSLALALFNIGGFLDFLELAGGAIAIIVAVLVVPTYRNACKELGGSILGFLGGSAGQIFVVAGYILMAVGNLVSL